MIEELIYKLLTEHSGLQALVGDKIFPNYVPEDVQPPYVVFRQQSYMEEETLDGYNAEHGFLFLVYPASRLDVSNYMNGKMIAKQVVD